MHEYSERSWLITEEEGRKKDPTQLYFISGIKVVSRNVPPREVNKVDFARKNNIDNDILF